MTQYHGKCEEWQCTQEENILIWREFEKKVNNSIMKTKKKIIPWKFGRKVWHSKEWKMKKRELKILRKMKRGKTNRKNTLKKERNIYKI